MKLKSFFASLVFAAVFANSNAAQSDASLNLPVVSGLFTGTMDSLANYSCPDWFRDAKFGIWAHWGPQAVPMEGDWYARKMYQQGPADYKDHLRAGAILRRTAGRTSFHCGRPRNGNRRS